MNLSEPFLVKLEVQLSQPVPSFKNRKRAIRTEQGQMRTLTEPDVKKRMDEIERGIESALYLACQTGCAVTDLECQKQRRIALSEQLKDLTDDSLNEIPEASFEFRQGPPSVTIVIERL